MPRTALRLIAATFLVAAVPLLLYSVLVFAFRNDEGGDAVVELAGKTYDAEATGLVCVIVAGALILTGAALLRRSSRS